MYCYSCSWMIVTWQHIVYSFIILNFVFYKKQNTYYPAISYTLDVMHFNRNINYIRHLNKYNINHLKIKLKNEWKEQQIRRMWLISIMQDEQSHSRDISLNQLFKKTQRQLIWFCLIYSRDKKVILKEDMAVKIKLIGKNIERGLSKDLTGLETFHE